MLVLISLKHVLMLIGGIVLAFMLFRLVRTSK